MMRRTGLLTAALLLALVAGAVAQQSYSGTVMRTDPMAGVVVFDDGRMIQTTADSVLVANGQRVSLGTLAPGTMLTIYSATPVAYRDGRYVAITTPMPGTVTMPAPGVGVPPPPPPTVPPAVVTVPPAVVAAPPAVVVTAPPTVTVVPSGPTEIRGVVGRIDSGRSVIELMDGRKILVSADTEVFTGNGRRVTMVSSTVLPPGTSIVARASRPWVTIGGTTTAIAPYASGTVVRVDPGGAVVLNDGRVVTATRDTVFLIDNRPVAVATLVPGHRVVIYQAPGLYVEEPAASPFFPDVQDYEALPQSAG